VDRFEVFGFERYPPRSFLGRFESIAEVDPTAEPLVDCMNIFGVYRARRQKTEQHQGSHHGLSPTPGSPEILLPASDERQQLSASSFRRDCSAISIKALKSSSSASDTS
jgi:hypothetical protein